MQNLKNRLTNLTRKNEQGVSLVEILVYVTILAVLLTGVIALVISSTDASSRFTTTTATQAEVNNTQASIMRDLSLAQSIHKAGGDHIQFSVLQSNKQYRVTLFSWEGAGFQDKLPTYIKDILTDNPALNSKLPTEAAVMSIREEYGSEAKTITALTKGYDPEAYESRGLWLFSYYDDENEMITLEDDKQFADTDRDIANISRIAFRVAADAPGRASKVQAESSVTPPLERTNISGNLFRLPGMPEEATEIGCPVLQAHIPREATAATIDWTQVTGATQLYLTREEYRDSSWNSMETYTIDNPSLRTFTELDGTLAIGGTYRYNMEVETVRGTKDCGETPVVSVIPQSALLRNVNAHAYSGSSDLAGVNSTGAATNLSSDMTVRGVTRSAVTQTPLAGARYTVARGLTNQLSWGGTYGTVEYIIYRNSVELTRVPAKTTGSSSNEPSQRYFFTDDDQDYGNANDYQIVPINNGGNNSIEDEPLDGHALMPSARVLISPPSSGSTYSVVARDTELASNGDILSSNVVTVKPTSYVSGFRAKYATSETAGDCTVGIPQRDATGNQTGYRYDDNISLAAGAGFLSTANTFDVTQTGIGWGTSTCYRMVPYNDAGSFVYEETPANTTALVKANQRPERFKITRVDSGSQFYNVDYSEDARLNNTFYRDSGGISDCLLYSGPNNNQFGTDEVFCDGNPNKTYGGGPLGTGNWSPIGAIVPKPNQHQMFRNQNQHQIYGTQQEIISRWDVSRGARAGYNLTRQVESAPSGRGTISGYSNKRTEAIPYVSGNQTNNGIRFSGEFPGVVMSIAVRSEAANGLTRNGIANNTTNNKFMFATNPAPSLTLGAGYAAQRNGNWGTTSASNVMNRPSHGFGGTAYVTIKANGSIVLNNASANVTNSTHRFWSAPFVTAVLELNRKISWNSAYGTKWSAVFVGSGRVTNSSPTRAAGMWPEVYPYYWGNMSGRYAGKAALNGSSSNQSYWPNTSVILKSGDPAEPFDNEVGSSDLPNTIYTCAMIEESAPDFEAQGCEFGSGIAPKPENITAERTGESTYLIEWDAIEGATSYRVELFQGSTRVLNTVRSTNSAPVTGIGAPGTEYRVVITPINQAGESHNKGEGTFIASQVPGMVSNLKVVRQADGTTYRATWSAGSGADSYTVELYQGSTLMQTNNVTGTAFNFTGIETHDVTYRAVVTPRNLAGSGGAREVTFVSETDIPAPVSNLKATKVTNTSYNITWGASSKATSYLVEHLNQHGNVVSQQTVSGTQATVNNVIPGSVQTVRVTAINQSGASETRSTTISVKANQVTGLNVSKAVDGKHTITWTVPSGSQGTRVQLYRGSTLIKTSTFYNSTNSLVTDALAGNASHRVVVTTLGHTVDSDPAEKTFTSAPAAPASVTSSLTTVAGGNTHLLTWSASSGASSYNYRMTDNTGATRGSGAGAATSRQVTIPQEAGKVFYFHIQPSSTHGTGVRKQSSPNGVISTPAPLSTVSVSNTYRATWATSTGANRYKVELIKGSTVQNTYETTNRYYDLPGIANNSGAYSVRVTPMNVVSGHTTRTAASSTRTFTATYTTPSRPATPTVSAMKGHAATISWSAAANSPSGYDLRMTSANGYSKILSTTARSITTPYPSDVTKKTIKFEVRGKNNGVVGPWSAVRTTNILDSDYTSDGKGDWLTHEANSGGKGRIYRGTGNGGQNGYVANTTGWNSGFQIRAGFDYNGDGHLDVITQTNAASNRNVYYYSGKGNGTLNGRVLIGLADTGSKILAQGDFDNDGNIDFLQVQAIGGNQVVLYKGDGNGGFTRSRVAFTAPTTPANITPVEAGDFNGDGNLDIFLKYNDTHRIYFGNGTGSFSTYYQAGTGWRNIRILSPQDLNGDGKADMVVVAGNDMRTYIQSTASNGAFNAGVKIVSPGMASGWSNWRQWSMMRDVTNDGRADLHTVRSDGALYFAKGRTSNTTNNPFQDNLQAVGSGWHGMKLWENVND